MSEMDELVIQVLGLIIVGTTIATLLAIVAVFLITSDSPDQQNIFNFCQVKDNGINLFSIDANQAFIQFVNPSTERFDLLFPKNTFKIINSVVDTSSSDLDEAVSSFQGEYLRRKNVNALDNCKDAPCICKVSNYVYPISFDDFKLTFCFPLLYSNFKELFDEQFVPYQDSNDATSFNNTINRVLKILSDETSDYHNSITTKDAAKKVVDCYEYVQKDIVIPSNTNLNFMYLNNFAGDLNEKSFIDVMDVFKDFYSKTQLGFIYKIDYCIPISNEKECMCSNFEESNFLTKDNKTFFAFDDKLNNQKTEFTFRISKLENDVEGSYCSFDLIPE